MNETEISALGVSTDIQTACAALGISKSAGYLAVREGRFPCRVIAVGSRYVVPTAGLREILGMSETAGAA